jgi:hypothetical protein
VEALARYVFNERAGPEKVGTKEQSSPASPVMVGMRSLANATREL